MSHWADHNGFSRYTSHSNATNTQGVLVARPATALESGQFFKINEVIGRVPV